MNEGTLKSKEDDDCVTFTKSKLNDIEEEIIIDNESSWKEDSDDFTNDNNEEINIEDI